jgi:Spy/CpxP family protein refolding chaperone
MKLRNFVAMGASLAVLIGTLASVSQSVFAQGVSKQKMTANKRENPMRAGLKAAELTETQKDQVQVIARKFSEERRALRKELKPAVNAATTPGERPKPSAELKSKAAEIETREVTEIKAVLTPEQQTKFQTAYDAAKTPRWNAGPIEQMIENSL